MDSQVRGAILHSAGQLFIQHGYHGLSMRVIAETVGVSKAALYYHFKDKQELFLAILNGYLDQVAVLLDDVDQIETGSQAKILAFVTQILAQPPEDRAVIRLASQELTQLEESARQKFEQSYRERFLARIAALFDDGIRAGEFRAMDSWFLTWSLLGMMYPYFYPAQVRQMPPGEKIAHQLVDVFLFGIATSS